MEDRKKLDLSEIHYVKMITIGGINPNNPVSDESRNEQALYLNRCLSGYPKGIIIGKDITVGRYMIGEHELSMEKITYHVGFKRKPLWMDMDY